MAEKQYKNYDERFLKEDNASGSRPVISYSISNPDEALNLNDYGIFCKAKFEDGSYCQTSEDLLSLFRSGFIFALEQPGGYAAYSDPMTLQVPTSEPASISIMLGFSSDSPAIVYMVDAPSFEQLKQSES